MKPSQTVKEEPAIPIAAILQQPAEGVGEIDAKLVIPDELEELYGKPITQRMIVRQPHTTEPQKPQDVVRDDEVTTVKITTTTDPKDALDNVDMDE